MANFIVNKQNAIPKTTQPTRRLIRQYANLSYFQIFGAVIFFIGIVSLFFIGIYELGVQYKLSWVTITKDKPDTSTLVAFGFLMIMLGMAFLFPSMLESKKDNSTSSMRVVVFMITCLFVFLCAKIGWKCRSFAEFKLDSTWAYLMAAAMGSKALQSFSENRPVNTSLINTGNLTNTGPDAGIPPSMNNPQPQGPPPFISKQIKI